MGDDRYAEKKGGRVPAGNPPPAREVQTAPPPPPPAPTSRHYDARAEHAILLRAAATAAEAAEGADRAAEAIRGAGVVLRDDVPPPEVLGDPPDVEAAMVDWDVSYSTDLTPRTQWTPANLGEAEWAMGMVRGLDAELAGLRAQAQAWRERIDQWLADATRQPERRREFFEHALVGYADRWRAEDDRRRALPLPSGEVRATVPKSGTVVVTDEQALLAWLRRAIEDGQHDTATSASNSPQAIVGRLAAEAIKVTPDSVLLPQLRKLVKADRADDGTWRPIVPLTGERPPGLAVEPPGGPRYQVKPGQ